MKNCEQLKEDLESLKKKKEYFELELEKAIQTGDFERVRQLKQELEKDRDELRESLDLLSSERYKGYECLKTLEGHGDSIRSVIETKDGKQIISCSDDSTIKIWDKETGECLKTLEVLKLKTENKLFLVLIKLLKYGTKKQENA